MCEGEISNAKEPFKAFICKAIPGSIESITSIGDGFNKSRERYQGSDASSAVMVLGSMVLGNVIDPMPTPNGKSKGNPKASKEECCDKKENKAETPSSKGDGVGIAKKKLPKKKVKCYCASKSEGYKKLTTDKERKKYLKDYQRQLDEQQAVINDMSAQDFKEARDLFKENGRNPLAKNAQRTAGNDFRTKVSKNMIDKWKKNNPNATSTEKIAFKKIAEKKAKDISSSLAALHNPDNVLGGYNKPVPTKMGNPSINSSVGRQSADRVGEIDDYLEDVLKDETKNDTMNLELKVCKKKDCSE